MVNINTELRRSYFSLLAGNILINSQSIPIYYAQAPISNPPGNPSYYVLISTIFNSGFNDDRFNYTNTSVQLMIVTKEYQNNSGSIADDIAGQIFCLIIPAPAAKEVQITSGYVAGIRLENDVIQASLTDGQKKVVNRVLTFGHKIRHYPCGSGEGLIYYGYQDTNVDPDDFSNYLTQNCSLPISVDYGPTVVPKFFWLAVPADCPLKTDWTDLNDVGNAAKIGQATDLYQIRSMDIDGNPYTLYMTRYVTGFNGFSNQVKYS